MTAAGLLVLVGGAAWFASGAGLGNLGSVASLSLIGGGKSLQGRAYAVGADTLRIGGTTVRLTGIDAPESEQRCGTGSQGVALRRRGRGCPVEAGQRPQP